MSVELTNLLAALEQQRFFGTLEVKIEAGRVVLMRKTETIKPDCRDPRGRNHADQT